MFTEELPYVVVDDGGSGLHNVHHPSYAAEGDGVANDRTAISSADTAGGAQLRAGRSYRVNSDLALANPFRPSTGKLKPAAGATVTVSSFDGLPGPVQWIDLSLGGVVAFTHGAVPYVLPQWWGAKGDGATDCTAATQAALDALDVLGGGTLFLPPGTYMISDELLYGSNVTIEGVGSRSVIKMASGLTVGNRIMMGPAASGVEGALLRRFKLDQNGTAAGTWSGSDQCLSVNRTIGCVVEQVHFADILTMAIWCDSPSTAVTEGLVVRDCRIKGGDWTFGGISLFGFMRNILIDGNWIEDCTDDSIAIQAGSQDSSSLCFNVVINGNRVRNGNRRIDVGGGLATAPNGIVVWGLASGAITGNIVENVVSCGIRWEESGAPAVAVAENSELAITGNVVRYAGITADDTTGVPGHGFYGYHSRNVTVSGNVALGCRERGYALTECWEHTVAGNTSKENGYCGIGADDGYDQVIASNVVLNNGVSGTEPYGILLNDGGAMGRIIVNGNRSGDTRSSGKTQTHGYYVVGAPAYLTVTSNDFAGNATAPMGGAWFNLQYVIEHNQDGVIRYSRSSQILAAGSVGTARRASGSSAILNGNASRTITHGLSSTPERIRITPVGNPGAVMYAQNVDSDSFDVAVASAVSGDKAFLWEAEYTQTGTDAWTFAHGLGGTPTRVRMTWRDDPGSPWWVETDATNIEVHTEQPLLGNAEISWEAWYDFS